VATERLGILAAAAALREFTVPELIAYSGANANTVRKVLSRAEESGVLFEKVENPDKPSGQGRPADLWRLKDVAAVLDEIEREAGDVANLRSISSLVGADPAGVTSGGRPNELIASASEAVGRALEAQTPAEQKAYAGMAMNFLRAADPAPVAADLPYVDWWERDLDQVTQPPGISRRHHTSDFGLQSQSLALDLNWYHQSAARVSAFVALAENRAADGVVDGRDLKTAAQAIADGLTLLPVDDTKNWMERLVYVAIGAEDHLPPIALITGLSQTPSSLFPAVHGHWRHTQAPVALGPKDHVVWHEDWVDPLFARDLVPGLVVMHDDSPGSDDLMNRVLEQAGDIGLPGIRATVFVSSMISPGTVARVAMGGGTLYPATESSDGLVETINQAVARAATRH
jgi:hypothetical protein